MAGTGYGRRRAVLAVAGVATATVVLLSGCSAGERAGRSSAEAAAPKAAGAAAAPAMGDAKQPGAGGATAAPEGATEATAPRLIAYTAQLSLRSKEVGRTLDQARTLATAAGGYVAGEQLSGKAGDGGSTDARLTLKVPSAAYQQSLDQLSGLGEVVGRSSQADDLTQQVADVESRLKTQQASVDRVRKLMAEAKSLAEVVSLESELSRREAELESLQQRQQGLAARTSLSTITLQVYAESAPVPAAAKSQEGFWESVGDALSGGWHVLVAIVRGLLIGIAAVAPFLLVLAPVGVLLRRLSRTRRQRPVPVTPATPPADPAE
ncbi:hypothetical protein KCMC57_up19580 [Kitasatospora sp. CMC57]|uniref:DUF4349 domain-containing protein n=1 Tax=Kitasatospora sp. CMC57 TaxID=3231513 RepID=A0AB33JRE2_9ACTN